jgi:uroporphyrinogen decarboxylase
MEADQLLHAENRAVQKGIWVNHKERLLAAVQHRSVDRLPTDIWATPEVWQKLRQFSGASENIEIYDWLDIDGIIEIIPPYTGPNLLQGEAYRVDEWGMGYRTQSYGSGVYEEQVFFPLAKAKTIADLKAFPWPSPDWYDYSALPDLAACTPNRAIGCGYTAIFYWHNRLRSLERSLIDPLEHPEFTQYLIQRLSDFFTEYHLRCYQAAQGKLDITQVTDDFGSQTGLLISPRLFDRFYRQPMQRAIDLAHTYGLVVFHHDDGDMRSLLPRLVEMGVQVLNPVQWRCGDWDLEALKTDYGSQLCFHGGIDNQYTLPFAAPQKVRAEVRFLKNTLGRDGTGCIIAPCHNLQSITPVENIIAMYEEAHHG